MAATLTVVSIVFLALATVGGVVGFQFYDLAWELPEYLESIQAKVKKVSSRVGAFRATTASAARPPDLQSNAKQSPCILIRTDCNEKLMPHVPIVRPPEASKDVQNVYEEFYRRMSFPSPPNFIMTQGHSYAVARGTWELVRNVLVSGEIPRWMKETVFVAISKDRDCRYCIAAHIACCRMLGVDAVTMNGVISDVESISDVKLREMILFALKCSRNPQGLDEIDYNRLRELGLKQSEIMELVAMAALSVYANIIADATAMPPDEMFGTL